MRGQSYSQTNAQDCDRLSGAVGICLCRGTLELVLLCERRNFDKCLMHAIDDQITFDTYAFELCVRIEKVFDTDGLIDIQ